ncbi:MAG TPA: polyphenol oxidase family protein [Rectinemataceae bacterium]|nr:polyphenol oxidase family protein [Rectinemataceae bacterium]
MFLETAGLAPANDHAEFAFPRPDAGHPLAIPPRALLSLREAGSMRYLRGEANRLRESFFASRSIGVSRVVATELHHSRRLKIVETREIELAAAGGSETDATNLPGEDEGDGGPDGAEGRDGIVFLPPGPSTAAKGSHPSAAVLPSATFPVATVTVADCMPIWLWDAASGAWGLLHSGWKGTGILEHAVRAVLSRRPGTAASMSVILGPAIGVCCYDVPEARAAAFEAEFGSTCVDRSGPRPRLDIRAANLAIARRLGIGALLSVDVCTSCHPSLGSFRREGPESFTRMVAACVPR